MKMATHDPRKKPRKGILKSSSSFDTPEPQQTRHRDKEMTWDEMNILATHHPPDKDYGHMKINEPPTPYNKMSEDESSDCEGRRGSVGEIEGGVDEDDIASRLAAVEKMPERVHRASIGEEEESSEEESDEQKAHRKHFEQKRKLHYNEFQAVKLAKQLMEQEEDEEDEEDEGNGKSSGTENLQNNDVAAKDVVPSQTQGKMETLL